MKFWTARTQADPIADAVAADQATLWASWDKPQRVVLDIPELKDNFYFAEDRIIEFVPEEQSQEPEFQDDFTQFCHRLQALDHPGLLKLLDFGRDGKRLFRVWEHRRFFAATFDALYPLEEVKRRLLHLVEAFQLLRQADYPLETYRTALISSDERGFFVARHPLAIKAEPPVPAYVTALSLNILCQPPGFTQKDHFLLDLGTFVSALLFKRFPYEEPPMTYLQKGLPPKRTEVPSESPVLPVVHRLTELDPASSFRDLDEALTSLKTALEA